MNSHENDFFEKNSPIPAIIIHRGIISSEFQNQDLINEFAFQQQIENQRKIERNKSIKSIRSGQSEKTKNAVCMNINPNQSKNWFQSNQVDNNKNFRKITSSEQREYLKFPNVFESFNNEEIEEDSEPIFLIELNGKFHHFWEYLMLGTIVYSSFIMPINLCFDNKILIYEIIDVFIETLLIADIVLSFFTQVEDFKENIISSFKGISSAYIKGWFFLDLVTCFPVSVFGLLNYNQLFFSYFKWFSLLRLLKLIKYPFLTNKAIVKNERVDRIIKLVSFVIIMINILSSFFIFIGLQASPSKNWINYNGISHNDNVAIYVSSIFFHFLAIFTIGFGGIEGITIGERIYTILLLLFNFLNFPFLLITFSKIFVEENPSDIIIYSKLEILKKVQKKFSLDKSLKNQISNVLKLEREKQYNERFDFFENLPINIVHQLNCHIYNKQLSKLLFFSQQSYDFILYTIPFLKHSKSRKGQKLYSIGEKVDEMFIIIKGNVSIKLGSKFSDLEVAVLRENNYFGDVFLFTTKNCPFNCQVKSDKTELYLLTSSDFINLKTNFPKNILKLIENSSKTLNLLNERKKNLINLLEQEKSREGVLKKIRMINAYLFERDFNQHFFNNQEIEGVNEFLVKNSFQNVKTVIEEFKSNRKRFITNKTVKPSINYYEKLLKNYNLPKNEEVRNKRVVMNTSMGLGTHENLISLTNKFSTNQDELKMTQNGEIGSKIIKTQNLSEKPTSKLMKMKTLKKFADSEKIDLSEIKEKFVKFQKNKKKDLKKKFLDQLKIIYKINFEQNLDLNSLKREKEMLQKISKIIFDNKEENIIKNIEPEFQMKYSSNIKPEKPTIYSYENFIGNKQQNTINSNKHDFSITKENSIHLRGEIKQHFFLKKNCFSNLKIVKTNSLKFLEKKINNLEVYNQNTDNDEVFVHERNNCILNVFFDSHTYQKEIKKKRGGLSHKLREGNNLNENKFERTNQRLSHLKIDGELHDKLDRLLNLFKLSFENN